MFITVAGAGILGRELIKLLVGRKHDVVVVDIDLEVCETIYTETGATTIHGSATDISALKEAGASKADVVICSLRMDADNIACALLSKSLGVKRVIARMGNPVYEEAYKLAGVNSVIRVADILLNQILMEVEQPKTKKIATLARGKAIVYAVKIPHQAKSIGMTIRDVTQDENFPKDCVFTGIYHEDKDEFLIPRGNHILNEGDVIFIVSTTQSIRVATEILTELL
ncbi:TrkA family potassium uptake protein [bacterium]|nr:TrkA family potassium uptake protein [bacterium]